MKPGRSALMQEPGKEDVMSKRPNGHARQRKPPQKGVKNSPEIACVVTQAAIRAILDALFWWLDRGGRL